MCRRASQAGAPTRTCAPPSARVACSFEDEVQGDFATGTLVPLLAPWWASFLGFYLYHPSRAQMPRKLRAFIEFIQPRLQPSSTSATRPGTA